MFRTKSRVSAKVAANIINAPKYGESGTIAIDQTLSKPFNIDPSTGRPDYLMTRLMRESNNAAFESMFASLDEFRSRTLPEGMTDEESLNYMRPRSCQLHSEQIEWSQKIRFARAAEMEQKRAADLAKKQAEEDKALYEKLLKESDKTKES